MKIAAMSSGDRASCSLVIC